MNYDDLYSQFLDDTNFAMLDDGQIDYSVLPASFGQLQYITTMFETGMADCLGEHEYKQVETWVNCNITAKEAAELINKILECQPNDPPNGEIKLAKWIKQNKL